MRVFLIVTFYTAFSSAMSQGFWSKETLNNSPKSRFSATTFTCNNRAFLIGGADSSFNTVEDYLELDYKTKTWIKPKQGYPGSIGEGQVAFVIDSCAYIGLGFNSSFGCTKEFYKFDVSKDSFYKIATFPGNARYEAVAFTANKKGYCGLGMDEYGRCYTDFYEYNPVTNKWLKLADFPGGPRFSAIAINHKDSGFIGLGIDVNFNYKNDIYSYNCITNNWAKLANFGTGGRYENVAFSFQGIPYIGIGFLENVGIDKSIFQLDTNTGNWNKIELNNNFLGFASSVLVFDNQFIVGFGKKNNTDLNSEFYSFQKWGLTTQRINRDKIEISPNPFHDKLFIQPLIGATNSTLSIDNSIGQEIIKLNLTNLDSPTVIETSKLKPGLYYLKIDDRRFKLLKQ